jgi:hypothetical protein
MGGILQVDTIQNNNATTLITQTNTTTLTFGVSGQNIVIPSGVTFNTASATINYPAGSITDAAINASAAIAYSKLNLSNSIVNADIASNAAIATTKLGAGAVLQVVHAVNTTADTSSSGSYAASSLVASITPSSASNKILILLSCSAYASSSGSGGVSHGAIYRQIAAGGYSDIYSPILLAAIKQTSLYAGASSSAEYLDSPNTTSQVDYTLYFKLNSGTDTTLSNDSTKKSFTLLEIAG